jgi:hypothetical protein
MKFISRFDGLVVPIKLCGSYSALLELFFRKAAKAIGKRSEV